MHENPQSNGNRVANLLYCSPKDNNGGPWESMNMKVGSAAFSRSKLSRKANVVGGKAPRGLALHDTVRLL